MRQIYISGPIAMLDGNGQHPSEELINERKQKFYQVADALAQWGKWDPVNPLHVPPCSPNRPYCGGAYGEQNHDWQCYLRHDIIALMKCDAILMLPDWERSPGATAEFKVAEMIMIPAMFWSDSDGVTDFPQGIDAYNMAFGQADRPILADDLLPRWLMNRYGDNRDSVLSSDDESFWKHEALAVRRAVKRNGFKTPDDR